MRGTILSPLQNLLSLQNFNFFENLHTNRFTLCPLSMNPSLCLELGQENTWIATHLSSHVYELQSFFHVSHLRAMGLCIWSLDKKNLRKTPCQNLTLHVWKRILFEGSMWRNIIFCHPILLFNYLISTHLKNILDLIYI